MRQTKTTRRALGELRNTDLVFKEKVKSQRAGVVCASPALAAEAQITVLKDQVALTADTEVNCRQLHSITARATAAEEALGQTEVALSEANMALTDSQEALMKSNTALVQAEATAAVAAAKAEQRALRAAQRLAAARVMARKAVNKAEAWEQEVLEVAEEAVEAARNEAAARMQQAEMTMVAAREELTSTRAEIAKARRGKAEAERHAQQLEVERDAWMRACWERQAVQAVDLQTEEEPILSATAAPQECSVESTAENEEAQEGIVGKSAVDALLYLAVSVAGVLVAAVSSALGASRLAGPRVADRS